MHDKGVFDCYIALRVSLRTLQDGEAFALFLFTVSSWSRFNRFTITLWTTPAAYGMNAGMSHRKSCGQLREPVRGEEERLTSDGSTPQ